MQTVRECERKFLMEFEKSELRARTKLAVWQAPERKRYGGVDFPTEKLQDGDRLVNV